MRQSSGPSTNASFAERWSYRLLQPKLIPLTILALAVPVLIGALIGGGRDAFPIAGVEVLVLFLLAALFIVVDLGRRLAGVDGEASTIAGHLATDPDQQRLLARWLGRARWARFVGGFSGVLLWALGTRFRGDLLLLGTGGIAIGAMIAELHHIRPRQGTRTARLDVRSVGDYLMQHDARRMIGAGLAACCVLIAGLIADEGRVAIWCGSTALVALGAARLAQERVVSRPRPAVPAKLIRADDLARELAIGRGLARPATYFAVAVVARGCFSLVPTIHGLGRLLGSAASIYALYLWWYNRRLGLDFLMTEPHDPVLA